MVKIHHPNDPVKIKNLVLLIYGDPGSGKTSLASTASNPLLLDFDGGSYRSAFRKSWADVDHWRDIMNLSAKDVQPYDTVIVDTVGRCLDSMSLHLMEENPKLGTSIGALTQNGYGALKASFAAWLRKIKGFGKDVVLVAHSKEQTQNDTLIQRPDIQGGSYGEVFKDSDAVGYLRLVGRKRILEWDPQEQNLGKNPANLAREELPHFTQSPEYLGGVIQHIKDHVQSMSEEGRQVMETVAEWTKEIREAGDEDDMTTLVGAANQDLSGSAQKQVKALLAERARELGLQWDKDKKAFLAKAS